MVRWPHADLCVPTRALEGKGKQIVRQNALELKQGLIAKLELVLDWIELQEIMKSMMLCLNTISFFTCQKLDTW